MSKRILAAGTLALVAAATVAIGDAGIASAVPDIDVEYFGSQTACAATASHIRETTPYTADCSNDGPGVWKMVVRPSTF